MTLDPYLSVVAASRNDDHGGDLTTRSQHFVDGLREQSAMHGLPTELIIVEWNPPADRSRLHEVLDLAGHSAFSVRTIEVPNRIHDAMPNADQIPLYQMIAKNVGIRRARAPFVLATNVDILFSDELIEWLSLRKLEAEVMYRVDRYDVRPAPPLGIPVADRLAFCATHVTRINCRHGVVPVAAGEPGSSFYSPFGARFSWMRRTPPVVRNIGKRFLPRQLREIVPHSTLHTNACGDFTLLSKEVWSAMKGYPELKLFSMHLDSVLCHQVHNSGIQEQVLEDPMRIYHVEHEGGWTLAAELSGEFSKRYDSRNIPRLTDEDVDELIREIDRSRRPFLLNEGDWGLAGEDLTEHRPPTLTAC